MGSIHTDNQGDTEDILAEPDEMADSYFTVVGRFLYAYGWYIIGALAAFYIYFKNRIANGGTGAQSRDSTGAKSPKELQEWQIKEEQRLKAVERLQQRYAQEAAIKAERQKQLEEEKRLAKLREKEKLAGKIEEGQKLGGGDGENKRLRPEYNPLMGDQGSSGRVCFRRPGGGAGG